MPKYSWEARSRSGSVQKGVMEATSEALVEAQLKKYGLTGITIKEEGKKLEIRLPGFGRGKVDMKDLVIFTRQFATMIDSGLPLVQCTCPTFDGPFQAGQSVNPQQCVLDNNLVWSAAYAPGGTFPPPLPGCVPDTPGPSGCPLLSPKPPNIPPPPSDISCAKVCGEYRNSAQQGVEVGFTCDATLCTATKADPDLVKEACSGLGNNDVSEILKLETAVGFSCAASQICGCTPDQPTSVAIFSLNARQRARGIATQCDLNGTLCGTPPESPPVGQIPTLSGRAMIMLAVVLALVGAAALRRKAYRRF